VLVLGRVQTFTRRWTQILHPLLLGTPTIEAMDSHRK
jgi:hypothetical protein